MVIPRLPGQVRTWERGCSQIHLLEDEVLFSLRPWKGWVLSAGLYKTISLPSLGGLPVRHSLFWCDGYSVTKVFFFPTTFVERVSGLADFVLFYFGLFWFVSYILPGL